MIIVVDGYNLLKQIFPKVKGVLEKQRAQFIRQLGYYKSKKQESIKELIVVFDAGPFGHATREVKHGVVVVYSGQKSSADEWIVDFTARKKGEEILVVTSDRELITLCGRNGANALDSAEFYRVLGALLCEDTTPLFPEISLAGGDFKKYVPIDIDDVSSVDRNALDLLMEQESLALDKDERDRKKDYAGDRGRKGHTLSKSEKKAYAKLKKLY